MSLTGTTTAGQAKTWIWRSAPSQPSAFGRGFGFWGFYFTSPAGGG